MADEPKSDSFKWVKGQPSPNPGGRPSSKHLRKFLGSAVRTTGGETVAQRRELIHQALFKLAIQPPKNRERDQLKAIELCLAYDEGRPVQGIQHSGSIPPAPKPLDLSFLDYDDLKKLREQVLARAAAEEDDGDGDVPN